MKSHPGGISCLDIVQVHHELVNGWLVASGGDDNVLNVQLVAVSTENTELNVVSNWRDSSSTACQIIGEFIVSMKQCIFMIS